MGFDERHQSSSSGVLVAVVVMVLIIALLGILAVLGTGFLFVSRAEVQRAVVAEQRAVVEAHRAKAEALRAVEEARAEVTQDPRLGLGVTLDREGNVCIDGAPIKLDELKAGLVKIKDGMSHAPLVHIYADPECPVKHVVSVLNVYRKLGDIDYRITLSNASDVRMTATVSSYEPAAEWDHFDDGTFSAYDTLTLEVVAPERDAGTKLSITVPPTKLPENSPFRTTGARLTFTLQASDRTADGLSWGALDNPTIEP